MSDISFGLSHSSCFRVAVMGLRVTGVRAAVGSAVCGGRRAFLDFVDTCTVSLNR